MNQHLCFGLPCENGWICVSQASADFNFIQCTARDTVVFQVRGDGYIEIAELVITTG